MDELTMSSVRTGLSSHVSNSIDSLDRQGTLLVVGTAVIASMRLSRRFIAYLIHAYLDAYGTLKR